MCEFGSGAARPMRKSQIHTLPETDSGPPWIKSATGREGKLCMVRREAIFRSIGPLDSAAVSFIEERLRVLALYQRISNFDWPTQGAIFLLLLMALCSVVLSLAVHFEMGSRGRRSRRMATLAAISSTALFVGVFGTVMHIITSAFPGCDASPWLCRDATIQAVCDALWVSELGLAVAVSTFWCYRHLEAMGSRMRSHTTDERDCLGRLKKQVLQGSHVL